MKTSMNSEMCLMLAEQRLIMRQNQGKVSSSSWSHHNAFLHEVHNSWKSIVWVWFLIAKYDNYAAPLLVSVSAAHRSPLHVHTTFCCLSSHSYIFKITQWKCVLWMITPSLIQQPKRVVRCLKSVGWCTVNKSTPWQQPGANAIHIPSQSVAAVAWSQISSGSSERCRLSNRAIGAGRNL